MATGLNEYPTIPSAPPRQITLQQRSRSNSHPNQRSEGIHSAGAGERLDIATPTGYDLMKHFENQTILYIIPKEAEDGCPLAVHSKKVQSGGSFTDESKFEVNIEQRGYSSNLIVAFRNLKHPDRYLYISSKGKVKARNGYTDKCDFFVRVLDGENSAVVCLESARIAGLYLGFRDKSVTTVTLGTETRQEHAHFLTRLVEQKADTWPSNAFPKLSVFGRDSILNNFIGQRECVVRLFSYERYLAVDKRGNLCQTHNQDNNYCWFYLHDRGMGVFSLQSYEYTDVWIRLDARKRLSAKALGPDSFFILKESSTQLVCFEAIRHPGEFIKPPLGDPSMIARPDFDMSIVNTGTSRR